MKAVSDMRYLVNMLACGLAVCALFGATPNPSATPSQVPTVDDILARMDAARKGLDAFSVPVHFDIDVRKPLPIPLALDGVRYFERPDKEALVMNSVPAAAQAFQRTYAGLGTPETWPKQYDLTLVALDQATSDTMYELKGVPKNGGNVDHILLDIDRKSLAPTRARWFYRNGSTIDMTIENASAGAYLLPKTETLELVFPSYAAHAVAHFADYSINQPIPASVWEQNPQQ
jgi:hypothetical protein